MKRPWIVAVAVLLLAGAVALTWWRTQRSSVPVGIAFGNGRLEATEVDIATKIQGRIAEVLAREGETVKANQVLARMDTKVLEAQLREAENEVKKARRSRAAAAALVEQRDAEWAFARAELKRAEELLRERAISREKLDQDRSRAEAAMAASAEAVARLQSEESAIEVAIAQTERLKADLDDSLLKAPRSGRVLYRLAEPGEVLPVGGKVLTIIDLDDMYMTVFLPEAEAGRVPIGAEARIVLDALPGRPIRGTVSFVAAKAQFTPKEVETRTERQKLAFRVKVQVVETGDPVLKPGMPGVAYIRLDEAAAWPDQLK
jgi:HlyD family secretion protein